MGMLPVNVILASDDKMAKLYDEKQAPGLHKKLRGTIGNLLLKAGVQGEFRAHLFSDQGTVERSGGHQVIWLEGQNDTSMVFAVRPEGRQIFLVRLKVPEEKAFDQQQFRSSIALTLNPKKPANDPPAHKPRAAAAPPPPADPPPLPPNPPKKRKYHRRSPEEKKVEGKKFFLKGWLADTANLIHVLLTLRNFLEKKEKRRALGKVLVGVLRNAGVLPETHSPKSFTQLGRLLEDGGYIETIVADKEKYFRLTPKTGELLQKCMCHENLPAVSKPPSQAEAILGRMHDREISETIKLISGQMAGLASSFEKLAKLLGGEAS